MSLINTLTKTDNYYHLLVLRIVIGIVFFAHGGQKLFSWFNGWGLEGTGNWMTSIGLQPGYYMAILAGSAEFFGGIFLIIGLMARLSCLFLTVTMAVAILYVHLQNGFFNYNNGYEYAMVLLFCSITIFIGGSGAFSLDKLIFDNRKNDK